MRTGAKRLWRGVSGSIRGSIRARQENAVVRRRSGSRQLFVLFQGLRDRLMMEPARFLAESGLLSRNLVLLRDPHLSFYQRGISAELRDFDALLDWLAALRDDLPDVDELHCVGTSMGAFAAVAAGVRLCADSVHAFGLMTDVARTRISGRTDLARGLEGTGAVLDLRPLLEESDGSTDVRVYFAAGSARDRRRAERIEGLPGVRLVPVPGRGHNTIEAWRSHHGLETLFPVPDADAGTSA